jgi:signal peptidase I
MSIKRLVGLPGDTLQMKRGMLYRNGQQLHEPYAVHHEPGRSEDKIHRSRMRDWQAQYLAGVSLGDYNPDLQDWGPLVVPTDSFFGLGDNRDASYDGRYYGFAPLSYIRGRPWVVYFSRARDRGSAFGRIRWDRLGRVLH